MAELVALIFTTGLCRRLAFRLLRLCVSRASRGFRFAGRSARFLFGSCLVALAPIIRDVKTAAFEYQSRARADHPFHAPFAPLLHAAQLLRANRQRLVSNRLREIKPMVALLTLILVGRHASF